MINCEPPRIIYISHWPFRLDIASMTAGGIEWQCHAAVPEDTTMNRITISQPLTTQLENLAVPVEVVDETGRPLGHFVPRLATISSDDCPYDSEELDKMRAQQDGRPLSEIWRSLGAK
jgi:hypothetical protein